MTKLEAELVSKISNNLKSGDIKKVAQKSGYTREYVGKALSPSNEIYNQSIVDSAIEVINERESKVKESLKQIA